jgi:hypothetical protein
MVILPLAGHHHTFNGQKFTADLGPGETGDDANPIIRLDLAVAVLRHTEIVEEVRPRDFHRLHLRGHELLDRLADQGRKLALEITHASFPRVATDQR